MTPPAVVRKPTEFFPPELESDLNSDDLDQKTALLEELELLIKQKKESLKQNSTGSNLDVSIDDDSQVENKSDEFTDSDSIVDTPKRNKFLDAFTNKTTQKKSTEPEDVNPKGSLKLQKFDTSKKVPEVKSAEETRYVTVDEDLLKGLMGSMDELQKAISALSQKSKHINEPNSNILQFDRKWFISSGFIGAIVLFISGFFIGNSIDSLNNRSNNSSISTSSNSVVEALKNVGINTSSQTGESENLITASSIANEPTTSNQNSNAPSRAANNSGTIRFNSSIGLYNMADQIYGNPRLWVLLFEENFSTSQNPDDIPNNTVLNIPRIGQNGSLTPLERERLRIALLHVAQAYDNAGKPSLALSYRNASNYYPNTM
jgi:hypothetical protein